MVDDEDEYVVCEVFCIVFDEVEWFEVDWFILMCEININMLLGG